MLTEPWVLITIITILSFLLSVLLVPLLRLIAFRLRILDQPGERKIHSEPIPYLGGVAIYVSFIFGVLAIGIFTRQIPVNNALSLMIGSSFIFLLGLFDDIKGARAVLKFSVQITVAVFMVNRGFEITEFTNPFGDTRVHLGFLGSVLSVFWIVAITNAVNLLDGLDGLAGGVSAISLAFMAGFAFYTGNVALAGLLLALFGGIVGFLVFNLPPAKIFMGDAGSLLIGFLFSIFCLMADLRGPATITILAPAMLLTLPIFDTLMAILRRVKDKRHIFSADKRHLHHRILALSSSYKTTLLIIYLVNIFIGVVAALTMLLPPDHRFFLVVILANNLLFGMYVLHLFEKKKELQDQKTW